MQRISIGSWAQHHWMVLFASVVIAMAGSAVYHLNGIFGSQDVVSTPGNAANEIISFNPKHVEMEVFGSPGVVATITYLDVDDQPKQVDHARLPWAYDTSTTQPAVFVNVAAQGDRNFIGCRIKIDNIVKEERTVNTLHAFTFCLDKAG